MNEPPMAIWKQPTTYILCALMCVGALIRLDRITRQSLWVDEYWALYLATGRGNTIFDIPLNTLVRNPPACNFTDAPAWWHIWIGLASTPHPPLYHLTLRAWVDLFGDSDFSIRWMSAVFGLIAIPLIFDLGRALHGKLAGIIAAGMVTFAPIQIDFSQQARPYTLLALLALILWRALILIEQKGVSPIRLLALSLAAAGLALTHYFAIGVITAAALHAVIRFAPKSRRSTLITLAASVVIALLPWAPIAWHTRRQIIIGPNYARMNVSLFAACIDAPRKILFGDLGAISGKIAAGIALAFLVYLSPPLRFAKVRAILAPWLWMIGGIGLLLAIDIVRQSQLVDLPRYIFIAAPAVYLILCIPWGDGPGRLLPLAILLATILFGIDRWQSGPQFDSSTAALARLIQQKVGPRDAVIITGQFDSEPAFKYFSISHYAGDWHNSILFATQPLDESVDRQLATFPHVWVIGRDTRDMTQFLPGWTCTEYHGVSPGFALWAIRYRKI